MKSNVLLFVFIVVSYLFLFTAAFLNTKKLMLAKAGALAIALLGFATTVMFIVFTRSILDIMNPFKNDDLIDNIIESVYTNNSWTVAYVGSFSFGLFLNWYFYRRYKRRTGEQLI